MNFKAKYIMRNVRLHLCSNQREQHTNTSVVASVKVAAKTNGIFLHSFVFRLREVVRVICLREHATTLYLCILAVAAAVSEL